MVASTRKLRSLLRFLHENPNWSAEVARGWAVWPVSERGCTIPSPLIPLGVEDSEGAGSLRQMNTCPSAAPPRPEADVTKASVPAEPSGLFPASRRVSQATFTGMRVE